ncbi:M20/M25/M40 family metallo-hydrolase [Pantoea sp. 18069]|uniref:M20 family metallopeptidase n=1 Tax=Pantoea sp. 18069 TaxID=2681415 RepID=UPI001358B159|nr:M20/M25/M40 family metallo-hydrolase [Pantoea sp. 18069]
MSQAHDHADTACATYSALDAWIDAHFDAEVQFLQALVQVPTDTPPGNNAPHAERTAALLQDFGMQAEKHAVPTPEVQAYGMESITNLIVRRPYGPVGSGRTIALNAHGDVVPPGEGWSRDPYGAEIEDGKLYGRAAAVSKSDFASFTFAVRALEAVARPTQGAIELHFTYDEEFGGELGPGWLLRHQLTKPDLMIAAGFSYEVVTAHNGCLQMEVTVHGKMAHAAVPQTGVDALQAATALMNALYAENARYRQITSAVPGITHPYLNIGTIQGGTNTNVVPGKVVLKLDRRMIPEEDPSAVEAGIRALIAQAAADFNRLHGLEGEDAVHIAIKRLLLARAMTPLAGNQPLVDALQQHGEAVFGQKPPAVGTPLYTDVRLYGEHGIPGVIYGAGPRTVLESHAKRADERLQLEDLRRATKVIARSLHDLLG